MGSFSIWHWLIVLAVAVVLFGGGGKLSRLMGDFGRGLREFKSSLDGEKEKGQKRVGTEGAKAKAKAKTNARTRAKKKS